MKLRRRFLSVIMILVLALAPAQTLSAEDGSGIVRSEEEYAEEAGAENPDAAADITNNTAAVSEEDGEPSDTPEAAETPVSTPEPVPGGSTAIEEDSAPETVLLTEQTIRAEFKDHKDYETYTDYIRSDEYKDTLYEVNEIWDFMNDRKPALLTDVYPDSRLPEDALFCELEGWFPEDIKAEITVIPFEEEAGKYTENALACLEIRLYDADGALYIPEKEIKVTLGGYLAENARRAGDPLLLYLYRQNPAKIRETRKYAADILVWSDTTVKKENLHYDLYQTADNLVFFRQETEKGLLVKDAVRTQFILEPYVFTEPVDEMISDPEAPAVASPVRLLISKQDNSVEEKPEEDAKQEHDSSDNSQVTEKKTETTSEGKKYSITVTCFSEYDGNEYSVTVTYDDASGIPSDAVLSVSEIREGETGYDEYIGQSADALGEKPENLALARAFDISLRDPETGKEYQPDGNVQVSIELLNDDLKNYTGVEVVHIPDEAGGQAEVMDSAVNGESVEFRTDGFSVYVLTGVYTYTYKFWVPRPGVTVPETVTESGYTVANWNTVYEQIAVNTDTGSVYSQTVKNGEMPVIPQLTQEGFAGWYEGTASGTSVSFPKNAYDFDDVEITENASIDLFARFASFAEVVFHDQYSDDLGEYPVTYRRRAELTNGSADVKISDVSATYSGSESLAFYGWSETPVKIPGVIGTIIDTDENGCIGITESKDLYPVFQTIHWLHFYSSYSGSGATYIPAASLFEEDGLSSLDVPSWAGHVFEGWYMGAIDSSTGIITYSTQISDASGTIIARGDIGNGVSVRDGKLMLTADATLYARWGEGDVPYKIIVWKQKTTDAAGLPDSKKTYDFVESDEKHAPAGTTVSVDEQYKALSFEGFAYSRCDDAVPVDSEGYTVLNVYYDRTATDPYSSSQTHILRFKDSVSGTGSSPDLPAEYDSVEYGTLLLSGGDVYVPSDPASGRTGFTFAGWYADSSCSTRVFFDQASYNAYRYSKVLYETMPDNDLTIYAGWSATWYLVQIDPNYGTFNGTGGTWFWETVDGDLVQEYTQVTRDYVESSSGTYFYSKHDRAYYGYSGNEWDNSEPDRDAVYTEDPGEATEDATFEYAPGVYTYAGWYEVDQATGEETPYDFSQHVDHDTVIKLHWKKAGIYYAVYDAGEGTLSGSQDTEAYTDQAGVLVSCSAEAPQGYHFAGWTLRGDPSGKIYRIGDTFTLDAKYAETANGKETVTLDAVYTMAGTVEIIYDANGGTISSSATAETMDFGSPVEPDAPAAVKSISGNSASVSNLVNNSPFTLSDGRLSDDSAFAFIKSGAELLGWCNKEVYSPDDPEAVLYTLGGTYGVDTNGGRSTTLYAVWGVKVTYHLNTESATADWGGTWDASVYTYDDAENTYSRMIYINTPAEEPEYIPADTNGKMFRWWMSSPDGAAAYDFSQAVSDPLDLYVFWADYIPVPVHAADASAAVLADKTSAAGWTVSDLSVGAESIELTGSSHVSAPDSYEFAFAAAGQEINDLSEEDAITAVYYNTSAKQVYVTYADGSSGALGSSDVYFVYYQRKPLEIGY